MVMSYKKVAILGIGVIGAPEDNVHSPDEKVYKKDIQSMIDLYKVIMQEL